MFMTEHLVVLYLITLPLSLARVHRIGRVVFSLTSNACVLVSFLVSKLCYVICRILRVAAALCCWNGGRVFRRCLNVFTRPRV
jgi:ABC-type microcin C transport system permease subunit YejB